MDTESPGPQETPLVGGQTSVVVRVGDTVRRGAGPWTPLVHALLRHVRARGFVGVPEPMGYDASGREVLSYVVGEVGILGGGVVLAPWFRTVQACAEVGRWLRGFHDAQAGFDPSTVALLPGPAGAPRAWRLVAAGPLAPGQVVCHRDVSPYNAVRTPDARLVILDFDFARPGDPLEDLAWAAWRWVPLMADDAMVLREYGVLPGMPERAERLLALCEGYRASAAQRRGLIDAVQEAQRRHGADLRDLAGSDPAFAALVAGGGAEAADRDAAWVGGHVEELGALL